MTLHRFFVPPEWLSEDRVTITGPLVHQLGRVLRLRAGARIIVLDNSGFECEVELTALEKERATGRVLKRAESRGEPRTQITLYQALLKGQKFDWVLQKGTELGVVEFQPMLTDRCIVGSLDEVGGAKLERWQRIVLEAAEQSRRGKLPRLESPILLRQACERARRGGMLSLIPWEEEKAKSLRAVLKAGKQGKTGKEGWKVGLFVGPEGGLTTEEVELAKHYGVVPVTLGPRILRAETAGLVTAAAILHELGDLE